MTSKIFGIPLVLFFFTLFVVTPGIVVATLYQTANQKRFEALELKLLDNNNKMVLMEGGINGKLDTINAQFVTPTPTPSFNPGKIVPVKPISDIN